MESRKHEESTRLEYEETELRLGLPGGNMSSNLHKRGFSETIDLKLNLTSNSSASSSSSTHNQLNVNSCDINNRQADHDDKPDDDNSTAKPPTK